MAESGFVGGMGAASATRILEDWKGLFFLCDVEGEEEGKVGQSFETCPFLQHRKHPPSFIRRVRSAGVSFPSFVVAVSTSMAMGSQVFGEGAVLLALKPFHACSTHQVFCAKAIAFFVQLSRVFFILTLRAMALEMWMGILLAKICTASRSLIFDLDERATKQET